MTDQAAFALNLHRVAVPDPTSNACWSPFSVASALALAREASRGRTRVELDALLTDFSPDDALDVPELALANTLWADDVLPLNPDFPLTRSVRRAPFSSAPQTVRKIINADVEEATRGLIHDLLGEDSVSADTVAIIVNALYLKVGWLTAFDAGATEPRLFHAPGGAVEVPTMKVVAQFGYARHPGWQTVVLPAASGVEAVILLPDTSLEQPLDPSVFEVRGSTDIELALPKVDVRAKFALSETLERLGVAEMFSSSADLTGLSPARLVVSEVIHEAVLRLDEQGLEGAAATAVLMAFGAMPQLPAEPIVVTVDRPFLLAVRHARSGAVYFLAQVASP